MYVCTDRFSASVGVVELFEDRAISPGTSASVKSVITVLDYGRLLRFQGTYVMYVCICKYVYCMYVMYVSAYVSMCMYCMYVHICVCMIVCMYVMYVHTYLIME